MRKVFIKGYINYDNENYTFIYEDEKLTLISVENHQTFFNEYKYVDEFIGFTVDGFDIVFYRMYQRLNIQCRDQLSFL